MMVITLKKTVKSTAVSGVTREDSRMHSVIPSTNQINPTRLSTGIRFGQSMASNMVSSMMPTLTPKPIGFLARNRKPPIGVRRANPSTNSVMTSADSTYSHGISGLRMRNPPLSLLGSFVSIRFLIEGLSSATIVCFRITHRISYHAQIPCCFSPYPASRSDLMCRSARAS